MKQYLLPTMYQSGGVGIAAIQVGLPIRAFIVDIPDTQVLRSDYVDGTDVMVFLNGLLASGSTVVVKEVYWEYRDGTMLQKTRFRKKAPMLQEVDGQNQVVDITQEDIVVDDESIIDVLIERKPYFFLNPELVLDEQGKKIDLPEGCLSVPLTVVKKQYANNNMLVTRPLNVCISYADGDMNTKEMKVDGSISEYWKWFSRCIQHENDHLNGILYVDRLHD